MPDPIFPTATPAPAAATTNQTNQAPFYVIVPPNQAAPAGPVVVSSGPSLLWLLGGLAGIALLMLLGAWLFRWVSPPVQYWTSGPSLPAGYYGTPPAIGVEKTPMPVESHGSGPLTVVGNPATYCETVPGYTVANGSGLVIHHDSRPIDGPVCTALPRAEHTSAVRDCMMINDVNRAIDHDYAVPIVIEAPMPARCGSSCSRCRRSCGMYCRCSGNGPGPCRCR